jgi:DNA-binding SARP family transcriptional activator
MQLDFRVLGSLEVSRDGVVLPLARGKERTLLALLLVHRNEVLPVDRLIDELWSGAPPATAQTALHGYVGKLRKLLGERLETRGSGYVLRVETGELDAERFEALLGEGRVADALALWRGPPLLDIQDAPFVLAEQGRLNELRLVALERSLEAKVEDGRAGEAVIELEALVREQPFRERLRALLMLALYRAGRQADALAAYRDLRRLFDDELGIEPSQEVRQLEQRILAQDPTLAPSLAPQAEPAGPPRQERKVVTVVRCELLSSDLDPERVGSSLERLVDAGAESIERHGGTVVTTAGDAVVGFFGLHRSREDDALRALQAATRLAEIPDVRVGVATGEVVTGGRLPVPVGEAVSAAARLGAGSSPGAVLLDAATYFRCRDVVSVETVSPEIYRLSSEPSAAKPLARRLDVPLVGRERELADLHEAFTRTAQRRAPSVMTVLGSPGLGKTRLAREFCADLAGRARVLTGHCVPYGMGVAYGPLQEIAESLDGHVDAAGLTEGQPTQQEKIRAFRLVVRTLAAAAPLVLVVEDAHWADESFLDLLEHVVDFDADLPLLVLVLARPEFADEHADWIGRRQNARSLRLGVLSPPEARAHVDHLGPGATAELRAQVVATAEGNPLFAEQLLSHALDQGGAVETPATLEALLAARVDGLEPLERASLGAAAVVGEEFSLTDVRELLADAPDLVALVRRDLIRPEDPETFRFSHALVRDAAYAGLLKRTRAELHERFADCLEQRSPGEDALVGYHLEAAHRALAETGVEDAHAAELSRRAAHALGAAGWAALRRSDFASAEALAARGLALLGGGARRPDLLILQGRATSGLRGHHKGSALLREAADEARRLGDTEAEQLAELYLLQQRLVLEADLPTDELDRLGAEALAVAESSEAAGEERVASLAWLVVHSSHYLRGHYQRGLDALDHVIAHGRRSGTLEVRMISRAMLLHLYGPTSSSRALACAEQLLADDVGLAATADALAYGGVLHAMRGDAALGRGWVARSQQLWLEAGTDVSGWFGEQGAVEVLAGDWRAAQTTLRQQCDLLAGEGVGSVYATYAVALAQVLLQLGENDEAERVALDANARGAGFDVPVQAAWRAVYACALARRGGHEQAEGPAREAVALAFDTDDLWCRGDVHLRVSEVHALAGRPDAAVATATAALESYEAKEHLVGVSWARSAMARLSASSA